MHFMQITFCTDAFAGVHHLTPERRADLIAAMIEDGSFDMRSSIFDVADITENVAALVEAVEVDAMSDA